MIVLLDLNFTLAKVDHSDKRALKVRIPQETYRGWIPKLCQRYGATVILTTARPEWAKEETLARIQSELKWQPHDAFFAQISDGMPQHKKHDNLRRIVEKYGDPNQHSDGPWFGMESNPATRAMYARYGIPSLPVPKTTRWGKMPEEAFTALTAELRFGGESDWPFALPSYR